MLDALQITRMHDEATLLWHQDHREPDALATATAEASNPAPASQDAGMSGSHAQTPSGLIEIALSHHRANFDLWHEEDKAREPEASNARITSVKHAIDSLNQTRNDLVETIDRLLLTEAGSQNPVAPLHSESPGLIIDRLSILALKCYHTAEESHRASASEAHRERNVDRLALLEEQRSDLAACLDALWKQVLAGDRRFKLYRQMKMYNDADLNPAVYSHKTSAPKTAATVTGAHRPG